MKKTVSVLLLVACLCVALMMPASVKKIKLTQCILANSSQNHFFKAPFSLFVSFDLVTANTTFSILHQYTKDYTTINHLFQAQIPTDTQCQSINFRVQILHFHTVINKLKNKTTEMVVLWVIDRCFSFWLKRIVWLGRGFHLRLHRGCQALLL